MTDWNPQPWPIDPEHGRVTGPGFLGDSFHSLRVRELFRYYQPPTADEYRQVAPINTGNDFIKESIHIAAVDPILAAFANLTTRVMDMRRCVVSMTGAGTSYVIAESTRTLSLTYPHTHGPGDALMLGGGVATSSLGGLCEHTCSLLPPPPDSNEPFLLEIPDLSRHPKFCNVGYVRDWPHARFYCGAPLRTKNGVTIGTVCVLDERMRYDGLTERERLTMSTMADLFMEYFETKEGSRFRKKGQMMEMELSRFISEGFLPSEKTQMVERRNGRLWSESILEAKRQEEKERREKVLARRQLIQEMDYAKMVTQDQELAATPERQIAGSSISADAEGNLVSDMCHLCGLVGAPHDTLDSNTRAPDPMGSVLRDPQPTNGISRQDPPLEEYIPIVHPLQPGLIELVPASSARETVSLLETVGTALPSTHSGTNAETGILENLAETMDSFGFGTGPPNKDPAALSPAEAQFEEGASPFAEGRPKTNASSSISSSLATQSESLAPTTVASSLQSLTSKQKRSKYEEIASMEPHVRAMFARASTVIKNTIDCDVVFVHGDLEGFFEPDFVEGDPHDSEEWAFWHVSTDDKSASKHRAKRPKQYRQRSGVLGYATSKGSSSARFDGPKNITDIGFDMSELREEHLQFLLKDSKGGKIFSFFDEYPGLEEHEDPEELECKKMLQKFLPGCRSVIIVPLHDHNHALSSVLFAWTCSDQKTFYGDEEGRFATGVAASLMDEMARMHILSADKAKSEFISSISHELRSPLHGILASAEFLIDCDLKPDQRSFVETILSCGTTLLDTVNHVLDFQKLNFLRDENINRVEAPPSPDGELASSGGEEPSHTPKRTNSRGSDNAESFFDKRSVDTDFSTIVQEVTEGVVLGYEFKDLSKIFGQTDEVKKAALTAPTKVSRIQVVVDIDEFDGGWVFRSNPAAMKRIVGNLVGNAIKYSHESGWIKVTLAAKKITPASNGAPRAKVSFIVSDSGRGMSREFLKTRLFTPFTQENPMAPGAGLGLSIVRQLVDMLDGKIDVKSQLGKGTTFRIELKLTQATPKKTDNLDPLRDSIVSKTSKMKAVMLGFEHFARPETPEQRGESFLYESLTRYVRDWLQMEVVVDPGSSDAAGSQIIILNELSATTKLFELPILKNGPVIVLCNSTPRRSVLDKFESDRDPRLFTFLRKPCGPKKLMRAMQVCLETLENGLPQLLSIKDDLQNPLPFPEMPELLDPAVSRSHIDVADEADFTSLSILPLAAADNSPVSQNQAMIPTANATQQWQQPGPQQKPPFSSDLGSLSRASNPPIKIHTSAEKPGLERRPAAVPMVPTPAPAILDSSPQQPKILCVEDNRINMMLVTTYLKKKNYPFKMAVDGADALEKVKEEATYGGFDCILMDLQMPIMSGIESTREIRALEKQFPEEFKRSFIIALTGLAAGTDRHEAFDAGVDAFMVKPVSFKDLEKMLQQHVRQGRRNSSVRTTAKEKDMWKGNGSGIISVESERGKMIEIKTRLGASAAKPLLEKEGEEGR